MGPSVGTVCSFDMSVLFIFNVIIFLSMIYMYFYFVNFIIINVILLILFQLAYKALSMVGHHV